MDYGGRVAPIISLSLQKMKTHEAVNMVPYAAPQSRHEHIFSHTAYSPYHNRVHCGYF